jgi:hypothetical protein
MILLVLIIVTEFIRKVTSFTHFGVTCFFIEE